MALLFTIDASVFVAACHPREPGHSASRAFLEDLRLTSVPLIEPAILPVEAAAALRRSGTTITLAREYAEAILGLPHLTIVAVDARLARRAIITATQSQLRGADALYVTVAAQYGTHLVTLDGEQLRRAPAVVHACKPETAAALLK